MKNNHWVLAIATLLGAAIPGANGPTLANEIKNFKYYGPGQLTPGSGSGQVDRTIFFPDMAFPLAVGIGKGPTRENALAYANSQVYGKLQYTFPWRDNYCEKRTWDMPLCPGKNGHQGQDIRPTSKKDNYWIAVAMDDGKVTSITKNTTVHVRADAGYTCRYLHLHPNSLRSISVGQRVKKGKTVIGRVSNWMGKKPNTSIHLHFDCYRNVNRRLLRLPVYTSLVSSFRVAWGLPSANNDGKLLFDNERELSGSNRGPTTPDTSPKACTEQDLIGTEGSFKFSSLWLHNCSVMGLVANGNKRSFVYYKPKSRISKTVEKDPILFNGLLDNGRYKGQAVQYNSKCGNQRFDVEGSADSTVVTVVGNRPHLDKNCEIVKIKEETLTFSYHSKWPPGNE